MANVQFLLDEAASLGVMDSLRDAMNIGRGYGLRLIFLYQSPGQLPRCWPEGEHVNFLANVTQVHFGVQEFSWAETVSKHLGDETIAVEEGSSGTSGSRSSGDSPNTSRSESWSTSDSWKQSGRRLLLPDEVLCLPAQVAISFAPGLPPIMTELLCYYEERFDRPPGRWGRWWSGLKTAAGAVTCFFMAGLLALLVTAAAAQMAQKHQRSAFLGSR